MKCLIIIAARCRHEEDKRQLRFDVPHPLPNILQSVR